MIIHTENCEHKEDDNHDHAHTQDIIDPSIFTTERGIRSVKWSFAGQFLTAFIQIIIV
ncbi:MAG: hypothetical protein WC382_02015 [Methanoregulaceae archaeon]|jgi:hypothetical protein